MDTEIKYQLPMQKITSLILILLTFSISSTAQTIIWENNCDDWASGGWGIQDLDGDSNNWDVYSGGEALGFETGFFFGSQSWLPDPAPNGTILTPDNILFSPTFDIPVAASAATFRMKVIAPDPSFPAEHYAVYVYDTAMGASLNTVIYEETIANANLQTISAQIPISFIGKNVGILVRHYDSSGENVMYVDDFEVEVPETLGLDKNALDLVSIYPNPVKNILKIKGLQSIDGVEITNQLGQRVATYNKGQLSQKQIDISDLSNGVYLLRVNAEGNSKTLKIIKN